jgi:hypothetical protein
MAEKKTEVEVKKLTDREMFGYLGGKTKFTPKKSFEELGFDKDNYFSITIEPMSDDDCQAIRSYNSDTDKQFTLWMAGKGKAYTDAMDAYNSKKKNLTTEQAELINEGVQVRRKETHNSEKLGVVQKYITKLTKPHPKASTGVIDTNAWLRMPSLIKEEIYNEIIDISYMSNDDAINLQ